MHATSSCPKHMVFGPCGGVAADGRCEVGEFPCAFLGDPLPTWPHPPAATRRRTAAADALTARLSAGGALVADFPARALDLDSLATCARTLSGQVDAVLAGDAPSARVQFPPSLRAQLIGAQGVAVWAGMNCRDRNRVALEAELAGLAAVGAAGVHCVTGDHTEVGHRPDAMPVFDLDSTRLAALARGAGFIVSVAESPASPPIERRADRLAEKYRAGADVCFVNHCGDAPAVARFVRQARQRGADMRFLACVPVVIDAGSAALLASFTSLVLPEGFLSGILTAVDVRRAGIEATVALSERILDTGLVAGINLSGGPQDGVETEFADALAEISSRLR